MKKMNSYSLNEVDNDIIEIKGKDLRKDAQTGTCMVSLNPMLLSATQETLLQN